MDKNNAPIIISDNNILINGYTLVRKDREGRGGGVTFYISKSIGGLHLGGASIGFRY